MRSTARLVQSEYEESIETAMLEEQAAYVLLEPEDQPINGIDIMTDARHGHRRNAKDTSVVALGARTNKVSSHIAVMHWNENVGRAHTSVWEAPHNPAGTRGSKSRRTYKAPTYEYRDNVWERHMDSIHL